MVIFIKQNKYKNEMDIKGNMGIDSENDDFVCKINGAKSFEYSNNYNINLKVKN